MDNVCFPVFRCTKTKDITKLYAIAECITGDMYVLILLHQVILIPKQALLSVIIQAVNQLTVAGMPKL